MGKIINNATNFQATYEPASAADRDRVIALVKERITSGSVAVHLPAGARLAAGEAKVVTGPSGIVVTAPIVGGTLVRPSALVVQVNGDSSIIHSWETQVSPVNGQSGRVTVWSDGQLQFDKVATSNGQITNPSSAAPAESSQPTEPVFRTQGFYDDFVNCMENEGVPGWIINGIGAACGVVCLLSAGGGCVACAVGIAALWANDVAGCLGA